MGKRPLTLVIFLVAFVGILFPISFSIYLAREEALDLEKERALSYAQEVVKKSEIVTDQIGVATEKLAELPYEEPCSPAGRALMQQIDLSSSYIQAVGYVSDNRMVCSSLQTEIEGLALGPIDMVRPRGATLRLNVEFPFAPGIQFLVVGFGNFAAIIHKDIPLDVTTNVQGISLATLLYPENQVVLSKGTIKQEWLNRPLDASTTFVDKDYVVAVARSQKYLIGSVSALPIAELNRRTYAMAMVLVPVGVIASILVSWAIVSMGRARTSMPALIKLGLRRKEFFLEYQPVVDLQSGKLVGAEALLRWRKADGEIIKPDLFIAVAEDSGLIQQLSRYVVSRIAEDAAGLFERYPDFHIGLNLSTADLYDDATVTLLQDLALVTGSRNKNIIVEATERNFTDHNRAMEVITKLRAAGFPIAIDDFGTGYSSLSYLERLDLDFLKIDKSFVDTLNTDAATSGVILHIIDMARTVKLEVIAEGVETQQQASFLRERGVQYGQGWLYGKPASIENLMLRLKTEQTAPGSMASSVTGNQ